MKYVPGFHSPVATQTAHLERFPFVLTACGSWQEDSFSYKHHNVTKGKIRLHRPRSRSRGTVFHSLWKIFSFIISKSDHPPLIKKEHESKEMLGFQQCAAYANNTIPEMKLLDSKFSIVSFAPLMILRSLMSTAFGKIWVARKHENVANCCGLILRMWSWVIFITTLWSCLLGKLINTIR